MKIKLTIKRYLSLLKRIGNIMMPDLFLYRHAYKVGVVFFLFAIWAFWPGYFSPLIQSSDVSLKFHTHGLGMITWCLLLISQAYLIRINQRKLHSRIGLLSYLLVPYIFLTTLDLVHALMERVDEWTDIDLFNLALMINATILFVLLYILAMYHRKNPLLHARYMLCTVFPLFTPVTDRLIYHHFHSLLNIVPRLDTVPLVPVIGFLLADILLILLVIWDWRENRRKDAFLTSLLLLIIYHLTTMTLYRFDFWKHFGAWFASW